MNSLARLMAAIRGQPFDKYPFVNPYPGWSMMPHWPELAGLTFLHVGYGSDQQRLTCLRALHEKIGLDWMPVYGGPTGLDKRYSVEVDDGVPVLVDLSAGTRKRFGELPIDAPITERRFHSVREVEALPAPATAQEILAAGNFGMARKIVEVFGDRVFVLGHRGSPFSAAFRSLTFEGLYEALLSDPKLVHAILERETEAIVQDVRAAARVGVHGFRINEYPCGAELLSREHYLEYVFPYEQKIFRAIRDAGLVAILEYLGWVEPRLPHIARLEVNCLQTESSLKGYRNDVGEYRKVLGQEVCVFGNTPIREVIELGDEEAWLRDAREQARGVGSQRRYAICAGSPTTRATTPQRLRRFGEFTRKALAELVPPLAAQAAGPIAPAAE